MRTIFSLLLGMLTLACSAATGWHTDILGDGYTARTVNQGVAYDGPVQSTIVRKLPADSLRVHRGVLYIHGFNDYFFNAEMGDEFVNHGYDFYAVDLRRYGRSLRKGQTPFRVRSLKEYFPDIDSALVDMQRCGVEEIALMGHSTGGLIAAYFMHCNPDAPVKALILNSPFLDWNLGWKERLVPLISWWGLVSPDTGISQGKSQAYAESLLHDRHGRWSYRTDWKMPQSPDVTAGWIRAITMAQQALRHGKAGIRIPVLLMYSASSIGGSRWTPHFNSADCVLDVADIARYGRALGPGVQCVEVKGGLHDLLLSKPSVVAPLYKYMFRWLSPLMPPQKNRPANNSHADQNPNSRSAPVRACPTPRSNSATHSGTVWATTR